ncbi:MAG: LPS export ABC transporter periplasmic protein LptC [Proteobacteria bacterium]|nr:LPS export ABC transporter periplasmic protein LptC [Pseudomonadota bacterium]
MPAHRKKPSFSPRQVATLSPRQETGADRHLIRYALLGFGFIGIALVISLLIGGGGGAVSIKLTDVASTQDTTDAAATLEGVSYKGLTQNGENFAIFADQAIESFANRNLVTLIAPRASVDQDRNPITIRSNRAEYNRAHNDIHLSGQVVITRPDLGYTLHTDAAIAKLDSGEITSHVPVQAFTPNSAITAQGMTIHDKGNRIIFTGKSKAILN